MKNTQKFCLKKKVYDLHKVFNDTFMNANFATVPDILIRREIIPLLTTPGIENSTAVFFGDTMIDAVLPAIANKFKHKSEIKPLENRTIIFQDISSPSGGAADNDNVIDMYFQSRQSLFYSNRIDERLTVVEMSASRILDSLDWYALIRNPNSKESYYRLLEKVYDDNFEYYLHQYRYTLPLNQFFFEAVSISQKERTETFLNAATFKQYKCPSVNCLPGFQKKYGAVHRLDSLLDEEHRVRCELCPVNTIKLGMGDGPCVPCTGVLSIDNGKRTACVDPYTNKPLLFDEEQRLIVNISSGSGCLLTLFILIMFVLKRHTPVVRSSDTFLSFLHLGSLFLTFFCTASLYNIPYLEIEICVGRNLIFSVLYTLQVSCLYTKSQKLVKAFASKIKLNASEIKQTMILQIFTCI